MPYNYYNTPYMQGMYNPYYQRPIDNYQAMNRSAYIQGKVIDNIDAVRNIEIPLDGSISYFPLTDGRTIVSKQLRQDGSSKVTIYKEVLEEEKTDNTKDEINVIKEEIETLKKQLASITDRKAE